MSPVVNCRICLVRTSKFNHINKNPKARRLIKKLMPQTNLQTVTPVICNTCLRTLIMWSGFKKTAYESQETIYIENSRLSKGLRKRTDTDQNSTCRVCLEINDTKNIPLFTNSNDNNESNIIKNMIKTCFPQLNFNITRRPILCGNCWKKIQNIYKLIKISTEVENKLIKEIETQPNKEQLLTNEDLKYMRIDRSKFRNTMELINVERNLEENDLNIEIEENKENSLVESPISSSSSGFEMTTSFNLNINSEGDKQKTLMENPSSSCSSGFKMTTSGAKDFVNLEIPRQDLRNTENELKINLDSQNVEDLLQNAFVSENCMNVVMKSVSKNGINIVTNNLNRVSNILKTRNNVDVSSVEVSLKTTKSKVLLVKRVYTSIPSTSKRKFKPPKNEDNVLQLRNKDFNIPINGK